MILWEELFAFSKKPGAAKKSENAMLGIPSCVGDPQLQCGFKVLLEHNISGPLGGKTRVGPQFKCLPKWKGT